MAIVSDLQLSLNELEVINADVNIIHPETNECVIVSVFAGVICLPTSNVVRIVLFDSLDCAHQCQLMVVGPNVSNQSIQFMDLLKNGHIQPEADTYTLCIINTRTYPFTKLKPLCKKNVSDAELLQRLENDFYPTIFTGLK